MAFTAAMVKELRERTGAGMLDCKKALGETDGDMEAAVELMRKKGMAGADKKADRVTAEGLVEIKISDDKKTAAIVEVNCETDFVAMSDDFKGFVDLVANRIMEENPADIEALMAMPSTAGGSDTLEETRRTLIAKIGENISVRRMEYVTTSGQIGSYKHGSRIGVMIDMNGGSDETIKDVAMHVAASNPQAISEDEVSAELIEKEKEIFTAQALESGKPAEIVEKMIGGRINKFLKEITLVNQQFVKNPDLTVAQLLKEADASVNRFMRFEVGEGIEKKEENFAEEVAAQAAKLQGK